MKILASTFLLFSFLSGYTQVLKPFTSDGCSMFPDRLQILGGDWCQCCVEHDIAYWQGGTKAQRDSADECLRECVYAETLNNWLADAMLNGVKAGGSAYFPVWYRWGYGWEFGRGYDSITYGQKIIIQEFLDQYYIEAFPTPCGKSVTDDKGE